MNAVEAREYIEQLESVLIDVLDGQAKADELRKIARLSPERAKEIETLFNEKVCPNYHQKHSLSHDNELYQYEVGFVGEMIGVYIADSPEAAIVLCKEAMAASYFVPDTQARDRLKGMIAVKQER